MSGRDSLGDIKHWECLYGIILIGLAEMGNTLTDTTLLSEVLDWIQGKGEPGTAFISLRPDCRCSVTSHLMLSLPCLPAPMDSALKLLVFPSSSCFYQGNFVTTTKQVTNAVSYAAWFWLLKARLSDIAGWKPGKKKNTSGTFTKLW